MFRIRVEATSANVCVGFDVLGLALNLYNEFSFEPKNEFSFKGFEKEFSCKENNLVYEAYAKVFELLNKEIIPVEIGFKGEIPVSRGLGSSSSLIVAGVFAANKILGNPLTKDKCFDICAKIEGHPDNVAPAIYGKLIASYKKVCRRGINEDKFVHIKYDVNKNLKFIAVIPHYQLSTHAAREVLPKELSYADIVNNTSRIVNIPKAFLDGDIDLLIDLFDDRLHEPYRSKLIKEYDSIKQICKQNGAAFAISGSGSTMLIITDNKEKNKKIIEKLKGFDCDIKELEVGKGIKIWEE